jgi:hypothetical protein
MSPLVNRNFDLGQISCLDAIGRRLSEIDYASRHERSTIHNRDVHRLAIRQIGDFDARS